MDLVKTALRSLYRARGTSLSCALMLGLGIGVTVSFFTVIDALFLRAFPILSRRDLVMVVGISERGPRPALPLVVMDHLAGRSDLFRGVFSWFQLVSQVEVDGQARVATVAYISREFLTGVGVAPSLGSFLGMENGELPCVLAHHYWRTRFHADPNVVGRAVRIGSAIVSIVGVAEPSFRGFVVGYPPDVLLPADLEPLIENYKDRSTRRLVGYLVANLRAGVTKEHAEAALKASWENIVRETALPGISLENWRQRLGREVTLADARRGWLFPLLRDRYFRPLWTLLIASALLLVASCASIALVLVARAVTQTKQRAVRAALGASPTWLALCAGTEALLLALMGALVSLPVIRLSVGAISRFLPAGSIAIQLDLGLNHRVLAAAVASAAVMALLFGGLPALQARRLNLSELLQATSRVASPRVRLRRLLVTIQCGICTVLWIGAGLAWWSLQSLNRVAPGFAVANSHEVLLGARKSGPSAAMGPVLGPLLQALKEIPGVTAVAAIDAEPWPTGGITKEVAVGRAERSDSVNADAFCVSPGWFEALGVRLVEGRALTGGDSTEAERVAVMNQALAQRLWPNGNAVGSHIRPAECPSCGPEPGAARQPIRVVGVAENIRYVTLRREPRPAFFTPCEQSQSRQQLGRIPLVILLVAHGSTQSLYPAVSAAMDRLGTHVIVRARPLAEAHQGALIAERLLAFVLLAFGLFTLCMCCFGLYAVMSFFTVARQREFGIRLAVGARWHDICLLSLTETWKTAGWGVLGGLAVAFWSGRLLEPYLYGIGSRNLSMFAVASIVILLAATFAGLLPLMRTSAAEAAAALRAEQ